MAIYLTVDIPDDAPHHVREGLVRRRLVALTGSCPCGATMPAVTPQPGVVTHVAIHHENGCPAAHPDLTRWIRRPKGTE